MLFDWRTSGMCQKIVKNISGFCLKYSVLCFWFASAEAGSLSLDNLVYLFICLFIYLVRKLFFKMLLLLHLWTDSFDIACESSLEGPTFSLCSAWRYGDIWRFGDIFHFNGKMVFHIMTQQIKSYVKIGASTQHKISENHLRVRISVYTAYCELW